MRRTKGIRSVAVGKATLNPIKNARIHLNQKPLSAKPVLMPVRAKLMTNAIDPAIIKLNRIPAKRLDTFIE